MNRYEQFARTNLQVVQDSGDEFSCICPFHNDSSPSFRFNTRKGLWICLGCGEKGNIFWLAEKMGVQVLDAGVSTEQIRRRLSMARRLSSRPNKNEALRMPEESLRQFVHHPYWTDTRHLSQSVVNMFGLAYDPITERAVIPLRNSYGNLLGVIYRRMDDGKPKYLYPRGFARGRSLYGSWIVRQSSRTRVAVVEGPVDALSCWSANIPALALLGSSISEGQVKLLQSLGVRGVCLLTDNDSAGRSAGVQVRASLRHTGIHCDSPAYLNDAKDPAELTRKDLKKMFGSA